MIVDSPNPPLEHPELGEKPMPELLAEAQGTVPVRPVWIPWPMAVLVAPLFWLMPKRFGPHFAAAGWRAAIAGYLTWSVYGTCCLILATNWGTAAGAGSQDYSLLSYMLGLTPSQLSMSTWPAETFWEVLRGPVVVAAEWVAGSDSTCQSTRVLLATGHVGGLLLAAGLMPFVSVGERGSLLLGRLVRLALWASTSIIVPALLIKGLHLLDDWGLLRLVEGPGGRFWTYFQSLVLAGWVAWATWMVWRASQRYVGPADGPGFEPRPPCCEACGYIITGLYPSGVCPECNFPVARSLPQLRQPTAFSMARSRWGRFVGFWKTFAAALARPGFFRHLAVHEEHAHARRYGMWVAILTGAVLTGGIAVTDMNHLSYPGGWMRHFWLYTWIPVASVVQCIYLSLGLVLLIGAIAAGASLFGYRPLLPRATAAFYWASWLPVIAVGMWAWVAFPISLIVHARQEVDWYGALQLPFAGGWLLGTLAYVALLGPVVGAMVRLRQAIRHTRYPNA